ncbi:hypothetical protein [Candidatus Venteria ishoeyi]|uniref:hypothetical protein n=1 Tax=Candidatus Venteria ishoeyi TaxID=1899563 RepID=UPI00255C2E4F|nr:hypothetical protein [Candidatus Venteria ishoeyi]
MLANLASSLATLVPLEYAPFVNTYFALLFTLIPVALLLWGSSYLWDSAWQKLLAASMVILISANISAPHEVWLNATNSQVFCGVISAVILFERLQGLSLKARWLYRGLLIFCGLSGVYTTFLGPGFFIKMWLERSRESVIHFLLVSFTALIQISIFIYLKTHHLLSTTKNTEFEFLTALLSTLKYFILSPFLGYANMLSITDWLNQHFILGLCISGIIIIMLFYWLFQQRQHLSPYFWMLLLLFPIVSLLVIYGAMYHEPTGRYMILPGLLVLWGIISLLSTQNSLNTNRSTSFLLQRPLWLNMIIIFIVVHMLVHYKQTRYLEYNSNTPLWQNEIYAWKKNPDKIITAWPAPRWKMRLNNPVIFQKTQQVLDEVFPKYFTCSSLATENSIPIHGLPVQFYLWIQFQAENIRNCHIDLLLIGEDDKELHKIALTPEMNQHNIIKLYSLKAPLKGKHWPKKYYYHQVKKLKFRMKSNTDKSFNIKIDAMRIMLYSKNLFTKMP